jgi:hypothetical protein
MFSPKIVYSKKDLYLIDLSTGINNYDYVSSGEKDQFRFFSKVKAKRYLFAKRLVLASSYRFDTDRHKEKNRFKNKNDLTFGSDLILKTPFIYKITLRAKLGQGDTKDDDERDDDVDYKYSRFYVTTGHRINPEVKMGLRYEYFEKDYLKTDLDHIGFYMRNSWRYEVISDKNRKLYYNFTAGHKEVDYALKPERDYRKDTLEIRGVYRRKKVWKAAVSLKGSLYDYNDPTRDKNRYYTRLSLEKIFPGGSVNMSVDLKYKYTDNRHANDTEEKSIRFAFRYRL